MTNKGILVIGLLMLVGALYFFFSQLYGGQQQDAEAIGKYAWVDVTAPSSEPLNTKTPYQYSIIVKLDEYNDMEFRGRGPYIQISLTELEELLRKRDLEYTIKKGEIDYDNAQKTADQPESTPQAAD